MWAPHCFVAGSDNVAQLAEMIFSTSSLSYTKTTITRTVASNASSQLEFSGAEAEMNLFRCGKSSGEKQASYNKEICKTRRPHN